MVCLGYNAAGMAVVFVDCRWRNLLFYGALDDRHPLARYDSAALMEFIRGLVNVQRQRKSCAATIGNFDGVHLGHQAVLEQLKEIAKSAGLLSTVLIFEPQPIEYFSPDKAPSRLTRLREKLQQFSRHEIDRVV